jgi:hypothetical protein
MLIRDLDTGEKFVYRNRKIKDQLDVHLASPDCILAPFVGWIEDGLAMLQDADFVVGHNLIGYDIPMLESIYPDFRLTAKIRDTLILSRLIFSDIKENDYALNRKGALPGQLIGSHSLEAWGHRLDCHKLKYEAESWENWTPEMEIYGVGDIDAGTVLWEYLDRQIRRFNYSQDAIVLEHRFADLMAKVEDNGFPFREEEAKVLYSSLNDKREEIRASLIDQFKPWYKASKWVKPWREGVTFTPSKSINYKDPLKANRTKGAPFTPIERVEFNPGSRDQIADRLQRLFNWKPKEFTDTGKPRVSEDILRDLVGEFDAEEDGIEESEQELYDKLLKTVPQAKNLADFFLVQKRIGQLAEGKNGWLKLVHNGKVHGSVNGLGAVTRRVTHAKPNMSQCPAVRSPYGKEMRSLWTAPEGWYALGTDLSGIEIRCFADVLAEFDEGRYADIVVNGDVHTENQKAFGVPTRDNAKTALYAMLYGSGDFKLGTIVGGSAEDGRRIKQGFMRANPAYKKVSNRLNTLVERQGWIPALDGGRLHVRSAHKALNTSLQSAGALVAKYWSIRLEERLHDLGYRHGWDGDFAFNVFAHDELFVSCRTREIAEIVGAEALAAVREAERHFEFRCPLSCEYKIGKTWADVH